MLSHEGSVRVSRVQRKSGKATEEGESEAACLAALLNGTVSLSQRKRVKKTQATEEEAAEEGESSKGEASGRPSWKEAWMPAIPRTHKPREEIVREEHRENAERNKSEKET